MNVKKSSKHFNPKYLFLVLDQKEGKVRKVIRNKTKNISRKRTETNMKEKKSLSRSYRSTLIAIYTYIHT